MWLYYGLVAFATRPKEKQHDEIPPVRMTYTGGTGDDHGHDLLPYVQFSDDAGTGGDCIEEWYMNSCDSGCGSCVQTSSCDGGCNDRCNDGSGRRRFLGLGKSAGGGTSCDASCDKSCDHLFCDQTSHLGSGSIYTHHTSCDEAHCETGCENVVATGSCDQAFCARLNGCDHAADCDESPCDDWYSAILSCDVTDGGESCDHGCPYSLAGAYHDGTDGATNEADGFSNEDCGFLNSGSSDCGR